MADWEDKVREAREWWAREGYRFSDEYWEQVQKALEDKSKLRDGTTIPSTSELDDLAARWYNTSYGRESQRLKSAIDSERARELRRARRMERLAITVACLAIGAAVALVIFYGILGYH